jgi:hypothetical protein
MRAKPATRNGFVSRLWNHIAGTCAEERFKKHVGIKDITAGITLCSQLIAPMHFRTRIGLVDMNLRDRQTDRKRARARARARERAVMGTTPSEILETEEKECGAGPCGHILFDKFAKEDSEQQTAVKAEAEATGRGTGGGSLFQAKTVNEEGGETIFGSRVE